MATFTPDQIDAMHPQDPRRVEWRMNPETSLEDLHRYSHLIAYKDYGQTRRIEHELARTAIEVRISKEAAKSAEKLTVQTDRLTAKVGELLAISEEQKHLIEEQKNLAEKLDRQTAKLIRLTWGLVWLTGALLLFTVGLLLFTVYLYKDAHETIKREQLQEKGQTNQTSSTNK
jgi:hypothetical protein